MVGTAESAAATAAPTQQQQQQQQSSCITAAKPLAEPAAADVSTDVGQYAYYFELSEFQQLQQQLGPLYSAAEGADPAAINSARAAQLVFFPDTYKLHIDPRITNFFYYDFCHTQFGLSAWEQYKQQHPSVAAVFVLPYRPSASWWQLTSDMEMVRYYPASALCFEEMNGQPVPAPEAVCVMLDDPRRRHVLLLSRPSSTRPMSVLAKDQLKQQQSRQSVAAIMSSFSFKVPALDCSYEYYWMQDHNALIWMLRWQLDLAAD